MRKVALVGAAFLVVVLLGRVLVPQVWHWATGNNTAADRTGVSDQRFADVVRLRASDGLFTMPELQGHEQDTGIEVHATYLASRILGTRFPAAIDQNGRDALATFAASPEAKQQSITRLEAYAALRAANDSRAAAGVPLADQAAAIFSRVDSAQLPEYLAAMEPANMVDPAVHKAQLVAFPPGDDQQLQRVAASAMALSYLFSNHAAIGPMFPTLQAQMEHWVSASSSTLPQFLISAAALQASGSRPLPTATLAAVTHRLQGLLGCQGSMTLVSLSGTRDGACSLTLTAIAEALPQ